jgi:hypothetical protein
MSDLFLGQLNGQPTFSLTIPPSFLQVNDICLVTRAMPAGGLATNSRVRILNISHRLITAETVEEVPRIVFIPRIRFKFALKYATSFNLLRTQFPLRLAYSMTYNKGQGQTFHKSLLDITTSPFAHGHFYVGDSRVRSSSNIRFYLNQRTNTHDCTPGDYRPIGEKQPCDGDYFSAPVIKNVVHKSVLRKFFP